ncbi:MAG: hypothetical protein ABSC06_21670, partial [Rhodopila sp.]
CQRGSPAIRALQKAGPYPIRWRRQKIQDQGGLQPNLTAFKTRNQLYEPHIVDRYGPAWRGAEIRRL